MRVTAPTRISALWAFLAFMVAVQPVRAATDLSGVWLIVYHEDWIEIGTGPDVGDFTGLPITPEAAQRALNWHASLVNVPERQCMQIPMEYTNRWSNTRIWKDINSETQELVAYRLRKEWGGMERTIYMDGRPRPPKGAVHTFAGFSLGEFEGEKLKVTTTHLREGYSRRNGVPRSDQATIVEHFTRHGDILEVVTVIHDPVYLTEPLVVSTSYVGSLERVLRPYPCESATELASLSKGQVPMYFPWKNPFFGEFTEKYRIPVWIAMGGAEQMYPEFFE